MKFKLFQSNKFLYILITVLLLYTLVGFFLLPVIGKHVLTNTLSKTLNREIFIEKITVNPFTLTIALDTLVAKGKDHPVFFSTQKIFTDISLASLFTFTSVVSEIFVENPYISIIRNTDASYNFSDLMSSKENKHTPNGKEDNPKTEMVKFLLKNIHITGGKIQLHDRVANVFHLVEGFNLNLPLLSSKTKNRYDKSNMDIDFVLNQAKVDIHVASTPFAEDLSTQIDIKTSDIDVIHYLSYLPLPKTLHLKKLDLNIDLHAGYRKIKEADSLALEGRINVLKVDVKGQEEKDLIKIPLLQVDIATSDVLDKQLNISNVLIETPEINLKRDKEGRLDLLGHFPLQPEESKDNEAKKSIDTEQTPFILNLSQLEIKDAAVAFQDLTNDKEFVSRIYPLNIGIMNFKVDDSVSGEYRLAMKTQRDESLSSLGRFQVSPLRVDGSLDLSNFLLNSYAPYYENRVNMEVNKGALDLSLDFEISRDQNTSAMVFTNRELSIASLVISDPSSKEEIILLPEFKIKNSIIDIENKKIDTGNISAQNGKFLIKRLKDGQINLAGLIRSGVTNNDASDAEKEKTTGPSDDEKSPWDVTMTEFDAKGFNVFFNDVSNTDPVTIDLTDISITADQLKTSGEKAGRVEAQMGWNKNGQIRIKGSLIPSTLNALFDVDLEKIDIESFQPYFTDAIKLLVTDGHIHTKGKLKLDLSDKPGDISFVGESSLTNFISLDKKTSKDFFKCQSLYFSGLDASVFPLNVKIKDISLTDFYSRIIVHETGETNLSTIFHKKTIPDKEVDDPTRRKQVKTSSESPQISVGSVTLHGGDIRFSDYITRPQFTTGMKEISGSVSGLSSEEDSRADLHLKGLHGQSSPLEILGKINPLAEKKFFDIAISFKDIEMAKFTPYSSKYLGYKIQKGKLVLDLEYHVDGTSLASKNRLMLDDFTLGEKVQSEKATSLPIRLAISLLKDRKGKIELDLPVAGELDDPKFKVGVVIVKMISNLILKVVNSPFSVVGAMFGSGEELGFVEFAYGSAKIKNENFEKLDTLASILDEKPAIKLEIKGSHDTFRDTERLKVHEFNDLIRTWKLKNRVAGGPTGTKVTEVSVTSEEETAYIESEFKKAEFPKPKDDAGVEKILDLEEKKKLLLTHINISKDDLRLLAMERSENIKDYLLLTGKVEKERIFLLEPDTSDSSEKNGSSKVTFKLR